MTYTGETYVPTLAAQAYHSGYPRAAWAAQALDLYSVTADGYAVARPLLIAIPEDFAFEDNAGTRPASLNASSFSLAWEMRRRDWNVIIPSLSYADVGAGAGGGVWTSDDFTMPEENLAEPDVLRVVKWARANAATYLIDPTRIFLFGSGDGATAALRALYQAEILTGSSDPMDAESNLAAGGVFRGPVSSWLAMLDAGANSHLDAGATLGDVTDAVRIAAGVATWIDASAGEAGDQVRPDARAVRARVVGLEADESASDHAPTVSNTITEQASAWHGIAARDAVETEAALSPSGGVPLGASLIAPIDDSSEERTTHEADRLDAEWLLEAGGDMPVEERVVRAVENTLRGITRVAGYRTDVRDVIRVTDLEDDSPPILPVVLVSTSDTSHGDDFAATQHSTATLRLFLMLQEQPSGSDLPVSQFAADVRKALRVAMRDREGFAGPFKGLPVPIIRPRATARVVDSIADVSVVGAVFVLEVDFRDDLFDPYNPSP